MSGTVELTRVARVGEAALTAGKAASPTPFKALNCANEGDKNAIIPPTLLLDSPEQAVKCPAGSGDVVKG